jgi:uncharacterized protein YxeA
MICPQCKTYNDDDAKFCEKCGRALRSDKRGSISSTTKILIVICGILILGVGLLAGMLLQNDKAPVVTNNTTTYVEQSPTEVINKDDWNEIDTLSGVNDDIMSFSTKGSKFKVEYSATPLKNYDTNYLNVDIANQNNIITSGQMDWGSTDAITEKKKSVVITSGPGNYFINIYTKDLESWNIKVYDYY